MNPEFLRQKRNEAIETARRWLSNDMLIFDTETTGIHNGAEIVEIAVIDRDGNDLINTLVQPLGPIPIGATKVHGIDHRQVQDAPIWPDVYAGICELVNGHLLVAYNLEFDARMVYQSLQLHGLESKIKVRSGCAMKLFSQFEGEWNSYHNNFRWIKLSDAARLCGVNTHNTHRALGDCMMTLGVLEYMADQEVQN